MPLKQFKLKPFKAATASSGGDSQKIAEMWGKLQQAIRQIQRSNGPGESTNRLSFEELYRYAYNMVLQKHGAMLYDGVRKEVEAHLKTVASTVTSLSGLQLLQTLSKEWTQHTKLFLKTVLRSGDVAGRTRGVMLEQIRAERMGEALDVPLMRSAVRMLVDLGLNSTRVYDSVFEGPFLAETDAFYRQESSRNYAEMPVAAYLVYAEQRHREEQRRLDDFLYHSTRSKLMQLTSRCILFDHGVELIESDTGLEYMLENDALTDLTRMYRLFGRVDGKRKWTLEGSKHTAFPLLDIVRESMKALVTARGSQLVLDPEMAKAPVEFVKSLLGMRDKFARIVQVAFERNNMFYRSLKEAFERFINQDTRCAGFLSAFLDEMFKRGFKGSSEADIDKTLDKVITIFRYIVDKDIFLSIYRNHLAKRLLGNKSLSDDAERNMIGKLKIECGSQFGSKLEGMFRDLQNSKDLVDTYFQTERPHGGTLVSPTILTQGHWSPPVHPACRLPMELQPYATHFEAFYEAKYGSRNLVWMTEKGSAEVRFLAAERSHELVVTTYMMCLLLQFNESAELEFGTLLANTDIPRNEAVRHLLSLTTSKARVLLKSKKGTEIADGDRFKVNSAFKHKMRRVAVPTIAMKSVVPEGEAHAVPKAVVEDRKHMVDAAVVRVMKTRQELSHTDLIAEVTHALRSRFVPKPADIKKRIENLIERDYLERTEEDRARYRYLA